MGRGQWHSCIGGCAGKQSNLRRRRSQWRRVRRRCNCKWQRSNGRRGQPATGRAKPPTVTATGVAESKSIATRTAKSATVAARITAGATSPRTGDEDKSGARRHDEQRRFYQSFRREDKSIWLGHKFVADGQFRDEPGFFHEPF